MENWNLEGLHTDLQRSLGMEYNLSFDEATKKTPEQVLDEIIDLCKARYDKLTKIIPDSDFRNIERRFLLMTIDQVWKEHLYAMDQLKDAIRFHGYAQKDPLMIYKNEGYKMFEGCIEKIATLTALRILNIRITLPNGQTVSPDQLQLRERPATENAGDGSASSPTDKVPASTEQGRSEPAEGTSAESMEGAKAAGLAGQAASSETNALSESQQAASEAAPQPMPQSALPGTRPTVRRTYTNPAVAAAARRAQQAGPKLGRNDPCWCGSGLKYKKCHGKDLE